MTDAQYVRALEVAKRNGLYGDTSRRFVRFLVEWSDLRGKDWTKDDGYNDEWAIRFRRAREYGDASGDAVVALVHVDGDNAVEIATEELKNFFGISHEKAIKEAKNKIKRNLEAEKAPLPKNLQGYNVAKTKPKNKCICKSAEIMLGKMPDFEKNFKNVMK